MAQNLNSVERLLKDIRKVVKLTKAKADELRNKGENTEIIVHQLITDISELRESFDHNIMGGLLSALHDIEISLEGEVQNEISEASGVAEEIREEINLIGLKLEKLRTGVLGRLSHVIDYLEDLPKATKDEAKAEAWGIYNLIADHDGKKDRVKELKEVTDGKVGS